MFDIYMFEQEYGKHTHPVFGNYSEYEDENIDDKTISLVNKINDYSKNIRNTKLCEDLFSFIESEIFALGKVSPNLLYISNREKTCYKSLIIGTDIITLAYKPALNHEMLTEIYINIKDMDDESVQSLYLNRGTLDKNLTMSSTPLLLVKENKTNP